MIARFAPLLLVLLAACASTEDLQRNIDLSIPPDLATSLSRLTGPAPQRTLTLSADMISKNVGNRNVPSRYDAEIALSVGPDGLVTETRQVGLPGVLQITTQVSACGLLVATRETVADPKGQSGGNVTVRTGSSFVAVPTAPVYFQNRFAAASVNASAIACDPSPGAQFSASEVARGQEKMIGTVLSFNRFRDFTISISCRANDSLSAASEIHPDLPGAYLKVTCEFTSAPGHLPISGDFAFLQALRLYIPLGAQVNGAQSVAFAYRQVRLN